MKHSVKIVIISFLLLLPIALGGQVIQIIPDSFTNFINSLPIASTLGNTDQLYLRQAGTSKQVTYQTLAAAIGGGGGGGGNVSTNGTITSGNCAQWASPTTILSISAPCGTGNGSVTSVSFTAPTGFAVSGSPITTAGTIALTLSGTLPNSSIPPPTAISLGGIESYTCASGLFANSLNTSGVTGCATPAGGGNVSTSGGITSGNCAQWNSTTTLISTAGPCGSGGGSSTFSDYLNIKTYGATGDGTCHPLSGAYGSLAAAQAVYPFVSDLTQCIDWAAIQKAINLSYTTATLTNGSFPVYCPVGTYALSNPLILDTPTNGTGGSYAAFAAGTTYAYQANVTYNGLPWVSAGSGNVGNPPTAYDTFPAQMQITQGGGTAPGYPWATVTISNASPAVVTANLSTGFTSNLFVTANQPIVFFTQEYANPATGTTPALPAGINAHQVYYVIGSSINTGAGTFQVSTTPGGAAVNTTGAAVGNVIASGQVWQFAPVQTGTNFSTRIIFVGSDGQPSNSGCAFQSTFNFTAPIAVLGPGNGNLVKNVSVFGNVSSGIGSPGNNGYRCSSLNSGLGPAAAGTAVVAPVGWAVMSNGGGAHTTSFENVGAFNSYINDYRSYGTTGELVDSNSWHSVSYVGGCINIFMGSTQSYINEIYSSNLNEATTNIYANQQEGVIVHGGNVSTFDSLINSFAISGVSYIASCGNFFACIQATVTSPDNNIQSPMCAYSAPEANHSGAQWLNSWPFGSGCGYNTFVIPTTQWGNVGMYVANYNPFTSQIVLGIPKAFAGIYQGACCGSNFQTQLTAATTMYASEATILSFGNSQLEGVHIENDGVPTSILTFATQFFGGSRPARLTNGFLDSQATGYASAICCNQTFNFTGQQLSRFYGQQVIPYINCTIGDCIVDGLNGGSNLSCGGTFNCNVMDRVSIATIAGTYLEMRHTAGAATGVGGVSTNSAGNPANPMFDFMMSNIQGSFTNGVPLVNPTTLGQLSGGYYAGGGSGLGGGLWDNGSSLGPFSQYSVGANNIASDTANLWRSKGWGQAPQWGVRPAPSTHPCILPSQATSINSLPAITFVANLQDYLVVSNGGTGGTYAVNDILTLTGGTFTTAAQVKVTAVAAGKVTAVQMSVNGAYTALPAGPPTTFGSTGGGGTGATFNLGPNDQALFVNYTIGYPMLWGGHIYDACNYNDASFTVPATGKYAIKSTHLGYSYFQNLVSTNPGPGNVPNAKWTMDGASPFIYMSNELLELAFPGWVFQLTGSGGCSGTETFIVLEVHPTGNTTSGYVKIVRADADGSLYVPALAASGTTCTGTTVGQAGPNLINPY